MHTVTAVIFDMDGLMFDTERLNAQCWAQVGKELNINIPESFLAQLRGLTRTEYRTAFIRQFGAQLDYDHASSRQKQLFWACIDKDGVPIKPGLLELLAFLHQENILAAMATASHQDRACRYLKLTGLHPYFQSFAFGNQVLHGKPDPELFLLVAANLQVDPEHCIVLEDSINGIMAGIAGGFHTVMIPDLVQPTPELERQLDAKLETLHQVILYIKAKCGERRSCQTKKRPNCAALTEGHT